ncbi:MAG: hypothetical protein P0S95_00440 [Rhabdochlamydiaceae bacterium]|nr:hypothetical protein [Candidatus Amphrikana amoebophyrae]
MPSINLTDYVEFKDPVKQLFEKALHFSVGVPIHLCLALEPN